MKYEGYEPHEEMKHERHGEMKHAEMGYKGMKHDIDDAPALAQADIGKAIGTGTDVAIETADIVLVKSDPRDVVYIIGLSKKTYSKMYQNLRWATGYNVFAIPLAAGILSGYGTLLSPACWRGSNESKYCDRSDKCKTLKMG